MHIQADRALIPAHTPSVRHLTITITAPPRPAAARERPPVNVALVLDRSGSMAGQKIEMARAAVAHAIKLLNARDRLSLVVYDDCVDTLLEATPAAAEAKHAALEALRRTHARGSTDLAGGWFAGAAQLVSRGARGEGAAGSASSGGGDDGSGGAGDAGAAGAAGVAGAAVAAGAAVSRVLLLTDGLANQGITDHDELAQAAARLRAQGISTSTFGVGADFDEQLLARLATEGGGHFYFIEQPAQIPDFLASEVGETLEVVARDVVLDLTCSTGVDATVLNGFAADTAPGRVRIKLGDLVADQEITLAVAVSFAPQLLEAGAFVDCRVTDRDGALYREPMRVDWRAADAAENDRQPVNQAVIVRVAEVLAERARATALAANRRGDYREARHVIDRIVQHLRGLAPGNKHIQALIEALRNEAAVVERPMEPMMLKARHFASYSAARSRDAMGKARRGRG
jgi:Ca-activated chloride channel family protein